MLTKRVAIPSVVAAAMIAAVIVYQTRGSDSPGGPPRGMFRATPVEVAAVKMDDFVDSIEAIGTALANESIVVKSKITETVTRVNFEDGQVVEAGHVLVELMDVEARADLEEAQATLIEAEKQYERAVNLVKRGSATKSSLDAALSARDRAQARIEALQARLDNHTIRAPFAGVVGLRMISPGSVVGPADQITTLDDISVIKLDFTVPETFVGALKKGLEVTARAAAYPDKVFTGTVTAIDTRVDPVTRSVKVRAELPNKDLLLKPGMLLTTTVLKNHRRSLSIPESALVPVLKDVFVYVVVKGDRGEMAERRSIKIGARRFGSVEVLSGVREGEEVVVEGTNRLRPGAPVKVIRETDRPAAPMAKRWQS